MSANWSIRRIVLSSHIYSLDSCAARVFIIEQGYDFDIPAISNTALGNDAPLKHFRIRTAPAIIALTPIVDLHEEEGQAVSCRAWKG